MALALFVVAGIFLLLLVARIGGARRYVLVERWPAVLFAAAALFAIARGAIWPALALGSLSALSWVLWPRISRRRFAAAAPTAESPEDAAARTILGVAPTATVEDIRRAYRARMAQAHPDRGGAHNEAARLTAARDRLLKKGRS